MFSRFTIVRENVGRSRNKFNLTGIFKGSITEKFRDNRGQLGVSIEKTHHT